MVAVISQDQVVVEFVEFVESQDLSFAVQKKKIIINFRFIVN